VNEINGTGSSAGAAFIPNQPVNETNDTGSSADLYHTCNMQGTVPSGLVGHATEVLAVQSLIFPIVLLVHSGI